MVKFVPLVIASQHLSSTLRRETVVNKSAVEILSKYISDDSLWLASAVKPVCYVLYQRIKEDKSEVGSFSIRTIYVASLMFVL